MTKPTLSVCLRRKRISLNRITIAQLGDPSHLNFWYDEKEGVLFVSATGQDDLDAYEIPKHFWSSSKSAVSCDVARIAFLRALQYRLNWEAGSRYSYAGTLTERKNYPAVAFNMTEGTKVR